MCPPIAEQEAVWEAGRGGGSDGAGTVEQSATPEAKQCTPTETSDILFNFQRGAFWARAMEPSHECAEPRPHDNLRVADEIVDFLSDEKSRIGRSTTLWQAWAQCSISRKRRM